MIHANPLPWKKASLSSLADIKGVCFDIDDTFSSDGKLTAEAYQSLWNLKKAGFVCVPITGRPAGWCDQIARFWPVDAVIVENGASVFYMDQGRRLRLDHPKAPKNPTRAIHKLKQSVLKKFPHAEWASDQAYREYDLAIDFCEAVPPWSPKQVNALKNFCVSQGAIAKVSSIHVNAWFGKYDKFSGFQHWLTKGMPGVNHKQAKSFQSLHSWIFIGDSPNDEPLFQKFPNSIGVSNLKQFLSEIQFKPRYITSKKSGHGFIQMAERLIQSHSLCR